MLASLIIDHIERLVRSVPRFPGRSIQMPTNMLMQPDRAASFEEFFIFADQFHGTLAAPFNFQGIKASHSL